MRSEKLIKEFKIEQLLDESFALNATALDKIIGNIPNDTVRSYGAVFWYWLQFE